MYTVLEKILNDGHFAEFLKRLKFYVNIFLGFRWEQINNEEF